MYRINIILVFLLAACANEGASAPTQDFVTATLPSNLVLPTIETSIPTNPALVASPEPTIIPIEGTTTTQVNVRAEPSTVGDSLGIVLAFSKLQVIGKEEYGKWYQVIYSGSPDGKGWVAVAYVQVDAAAEIPVVEIESGSEDNISGLVIQGINVRSGPGTTYDSFGTLIPNDIVTVTGKDPSGTWLEIEFANAPDGKGWAASDFLQVSTVDFLPTIGGTEQVEAVPTSITSAPPEGFRPALEDGDSMQAPLAIVLFSPAGPRALQITGEVSAPIGDVEDWVQFTTYGEVVAIQISCQSGTLSAELWNNEQPVDGFSLSCGDKSFVTVASNSSYFLKFSASSANEPGYTGYVLKMEIIR